MTQETEKKKNDSIGALWESENGYMTGNIEIGGQKINIICFANTKKKNTKSPDWNILVKKPYGSVPTPKKGKDDDIPF